jgi:hypothetical protein
VKYSLAVVVCVTVGGVLSAPACAQEEPGERYRPQLSTHFAGAHGLTGFGGMVDGRVPSPFLAEPDGFDALGAYSTRFSLRYGARVQRRELRGATRTQVHDEVHEATVACGVNVHGLDFSVGIPYRYRYERLAPSGGARVTDHDDGVGDLALGAKVAFRVPKFFFGDWAVAALAPYVHGNVPTSATEVSGPGYYDVGLAIAGPYGNGFRWIGNLAWRYLEGGVSAIVYRFGGSVVPFARDGYAVRIYAYLSGVDYPRADGDIDLEGGVQVLLGGLVTVDLGVSIRAVASGYVSRELEHTMTRSGAGYVSRSEDELGFAVTFGLGVVL